VFEGFALDPEHLLVATGVAIVAVVLLYFLWGELRHRARRYGGDDRAAALMLGAVILLLVALAPGVLPMEYGLVVMIAGLAAIYRPDMVIKPFGGPNIRWRALQEGRELQVLVAERGGFEAAALDVDLVQRIEQLSEFESPDTRSYLQLLREVLLADPAGPGISLKRAQLAEADAELRASLGARPTWERALQKRMVEAGGDEVAWATAD
jgi:hypothetical protein